jgi:hypothetical protein
MREEKDKGKGKGKNKQKAGAECFFLLNLPSLFPFSSLVQRKPNDQNKEAA